MPEPLPLAYHWDRTCPPPRLTLRPFRQRVLTVPGGPAPVSAAMADQPFDFGAAMHALCADAIRLTPALAHIDLSRVLFTITKARNGRGHGLQARVTPLRFAGGSLSTLHRGRRYQVQRFRMDGREILYLVTFVLPRFQNRDYADKLVTVFHELYHIGPNFDGDLRRHEGRYAAHTGSQKRYDAHMARLAEAYLRNGADASCHSFLRLSFAQLCQLHGVVTGLYLPRPKLITIHASGRM